MLAQYYSWRADVGMMGFTNDDYLFVSFVFS